MEAREGVRRWGFSVRRQPGPSKTMASTAMQASRQVCAHQSSRRELPPVVTPRESGTEAPPASAGLVWCGVLVGPIPTIRAVCGGGVCGSRVATKVATVPRAGWEERAAEWRVYGTHTSMKTNDRHES